MKEVAPMPIRNRIADVKELRRGICQAYIKMLLIENWKESLFGIAKYVIESNDNHKSNYVGAYNEMRDKGVNSYTIEDMDVSLIRAIVMDHPEIVKKAKNNKDRKEEIRKIAKDRGVDAHIGKKTDEELYMLAFQWLADLKMFVTWIDKNEAGIIDDGELWDFRRNSIKAIEDLMYIIDDERALTIQKAKTYERELKDLGNRVDEDAKSQWLKLRDIYFAKARMEKDFAVLDEFEIKSSDYGVLCSHCYAAQVFIGRKDYREAIKRIAKLFEGGSEKEYRDSIFKPLDLRSLSKTDIERISAEIVEVQAKAERCGWKIGIAERSIPMHGRESRRTSLEFSHIEGTTEQKQ